MSIVLLKKVDSFKIADFRIFIDFLSFNAYHFTFFYDFVYNLVHNYVIQLNCECSKQFKIALSMFKSKKPRDL